MTLLEHLRTLWEYEFWATARILDCLRAMPTPSTRAMRQLGHTLAARRCWLTRLERGESFDVPIWPEIPAGEAGLAELSAMSAATERDLTLLLNNLDSPGLERVLEYESYERTPERRRMLDILTQLVSHASYHRGYISVFVREDGGIPVITDYIEYSRRLR